MNTFDIVGCVLLLLHCGNYSYFAELCEYITRSNLEDKATIYNYKSSTRSAVR